jgi:hypothetical protein
VRRGFDLDDTWSLTLEGKGTLKWTRLSAPGGNPDARLGHAAVFDQARDRMLMVGGAHGTERLIDVWALEMSGEGEKRTQLKTTGRVSPGKAIDEMAWRELRIRGEFPPERLGHTAVHAPQWVHFFLTRLISCEA